MESSKKTHEKIQSIPKEYFELFLKECEWRFNIGSPKLLLADLKNLLKEDYYVSAPKSKTRVRIEHVLGFMTNSMHDNLHMRQIAQKRGNPCIGFFWLIVVNNFLLKFQNTTN